MNTNLNRTAEASEFRRCAKVELAHRGWTVVLLSQRINKSRNATSRAINRGDFPKVKKLIEKELSL